VVVPLILQPAGHIKNDIPAFLQSARARHPDLLIQCAAPLGLAARILTALLDRLAEMEKPLAPLPVAATAVLLVGRGSNVAKLARLLWEGRRYGQAEPCFWAVTGPSVPEGLRKCVALGARRVLVVPYLLFPGLLLSGLTHLLEEQRSLLPDVEIALAAPLGSHPALLELVWERIEEAESGEVRPNCDLCKYRVVTPGHAEDVGQ
jgi:sirohydrochlorin cobaltochelatase